MALDKKTGTPIEPELEPSIAEVEEPLRGYSGPLLVRGYIPKKQRMVRLTKSAIASLYTVVAPLRTNLFATAATVKSERLFALNSLVDRGIKGHS